MPLYAILLLVASVVGNLGQALMTGAPSPCASPSASPAAMVLPASSQNVSLAAPAPTCSRK